MTELLEAVEDVRAQPERVLRVAAALYEAARVQRVRQRDLVIATGLTRETIRRHVEDERIRRGEIQPTKRYLEEQAKRSRPQS